ncbi:transmembrane amino acid transporter protein-domain-containing protein [Pseudomassariella vexata]|uniref:Transmembrane amino acid transporter protein-domain-containing protein n=1 Tax=Pseudomassariella vexata TaxID=1141098 RepID=A0A1Y2E1C6_9PEZI|nr:transmembrane amino acid transporter protein-domain-containing protein [Pseudomassariella vexata]ORY65277.1 transmembrane amino acid transporter protein-domain-containing protein [Pseudomassariella vexata]
MAEIEPKHEKLGIKPAAESDGPEVASTKEAELENHEVFQITEDGVDFRNVSWPRATIIFLKIIFATGVLSIPTAMYSLGAVGGALSVIGWSFMNTYTAVIQGNFKTRHPECHTLADMGHKVGGVVFREIIGILYLVAYILCTGSGIVGLSVGFNALSDHAACTVWWSFLSMVLITAAASVRTLRNIGWLTWVGFFSIFIAILVVVIGVTLRVRPAAAPQTGDFDLGYHVIAYPTFAEGMTATATIFVSSAGTSAFLPVISEMRNPRDYKKALYICMGLVLCMYLSFSLVVYRWAGAWVTNPSLGSAGGTLKKVSYGIALIGLMVSGCLYLHVAAKYLFVRLLRGTKHLQSNTVTHWATWLGCSISLGVIAWILAEAIALFSYIIALTGSVCFAPMAIMIPAVLWLYDFWDYRKGNIWQKAKFLFHWFLIFLGAFITVGGTYSTILAIMNAYASGEIGSAFSCADNSGTLSG